MRGNRGESSQATDMGFPRLQDGLLSEAESKRILRQIGIAIPKEELQPLPRKRFRLLKRLDTRWC